MSPIRHLRTQPDDCQVGDWVAASSVPEWPLAVKSQSYQPLGSPLTEAALAVPLQEVGEGVSAGPDPWRFELAEMKIGDEERMPVWQRVS